MAVLTRRTLRVFAVLEDCRKGSRDVLEALLPFFQPLIVDFEDRVFDPNAFADLVANTYGWNFTSDIVEELIPRFLDKGWLTQIANDGQSKSYKVTVQNAEEVEYDERGNQLADALSEIADNFFLFLETISPISTYKKTKAEFCDVLVEWLVSIDAYNESVLKKNAIQKNTEGKFNIYQILPDGTDLSSDDKYLCARFVKYLFETNSTYTEHLCGIAAAGLLTEVVRDFQKPVTQVDDSDLEIYLDSSVALELLGVSGALACSNVLAVVKNAKEIGCKVKVFQKSTEEMQKVLDAVLKRPTPARIGRTADAIRKNEASEAYVREVARDPQLFLKKLGIGTVPRTLNQYPNEHDFFNSDMIEASISKMSWHLEVEPKVHDASAMAFIMRMRRGNKQQDIFNSKRIFVTRNGSLSQMARKFCIGEDLIDRNTVPPIIHQRQLAMALWLRTGDGISSMSLPRHMMLAACEQVLSVNPTIIDKVKLEARSLTKEKAEQLDVLLTIDRSVQLLQDKTLGISSVITADNIEELSELMKREMSAEIKERADKNVAKVKKNAGKRINEANKRRISAESREHELKSTLLRVEQEDLLAINALLNDANNRSKKERIIIYILIAISIFIAAIAGSLQEFLTGLIRWPVLIFSAVFIFLMSAIQIFGNNTSLKKLFAKRAKQSLTSMAEKRQLTEKLAKFEPCWDKNSKKFMYLESVESKIEPPQTQSKLL